MSLIDCKTCYSASMSKSREEFKLCSACSSELDQLKVEKTVIQTIKQGLYSFQIYQQNNSFKIDVGRSHFENSTFSGNFLNIQECKEAITSWLNSPFRLSGGYINVMD